MSRSSMRAPLYRRNKEVTGALPAVAEFSGPVGTESCLCQGGGLQRPAAGPPGPTP